MHAGTGRLNAFGGWVLARPRVGNTAATTARVCTKLDPRAVCLDGIDAMGAWRVSNGDVPPGGPASRFPPGACTHFAAAWTIATMPALRAAGSSGHTCI